MGKHFTIENLLKVVGLLVFVVMAWARVEAGITDLKADIAGVHKDLEAVQETYVRKDVSVEQNKAIEIQLRQINEQLAEINQKLSHR